MLGCSCVGPQNGIAQRIRYRTVAIDLRKLNARRFVDFGIVLRVVIRERPAGGSWVTRAKDNMAYEVVKKMPRRVMRKFSGM